jgi:hypothetical protein
MSPLRKLCCVVASGRSYALTYVRPLVFPARRLRVCMCPFRDVCMRLCAAHGACALARSRVRAPSRSHMFVLCLQADARTLPRTCARPSSLLAGSGCACVHLGSDACAFVRRMVRAPSHSRACALALSHVCLVTPHAGARCTRHMRFHAYARSVHSRLCMCAWEGRVADPRCGHRLSIRLSKML